MPLKSLLDDPEELAALEDEEDEDAHPHIDDEEEEPVKPARKPKRKPARTIGGQIAEADILAALGAGPLDTIQLLAELGLGNEKIQRQRLARALKRLGKRVVKTHGERGIGIYSLPKGAKAPPPKPAAPAIPAFSLVIDGDPISIIYLAEIVRAARTIARLATTRTTT